jgi:hypothetical protein
MDYPGWDDERHCPCGLIEVADDWSERTLRRDLATEVQLQASLIEPTHSREEDAAALPLR